MLLRSPDMSYILRLTRWYLSFKFQNQNSVFFLPSTMCSKCPDHPTLTLLYHLKFYRVYFNRLTQNDPYMGRTVPLTSKGCILYIYSTNIGTEYFKHALYFPLFSLQNTVCFIMLTCLVPVLFTFYIQGVLK